MHLCGIFDLVSMVLHGRLMHRSRGLTTILGRVVAPQKTTTEILDSVQNDDLEGTSGRAKGVAGFFQLASYEL